jgi:hypothetical protein
MPETWLQERDGQHEQYHDDRATPHHITAENTKALTPGSRGYLILGDAPTNSGGEIDFGDGGHGQRITNFFEQGIVVLARCARRQMRIHGTLPVGVQPPINRELEPVRILYAFHWPSPLPLPA